MAPVIAALLLLVQTIDESKLAPFRFREMPYRLHVPAPYDKAHRYPLVLYLHGGGAMGTDNLQQIRGWNGNLVGMFLDRDAFVVAPQSHGDGWMTQDRLTIPTDQLTTALDLVDALTARYSIDPDRIYILGQSLGGFGTIAAIAKRPKRFAGAIVVCGGGDESEVKKLARVPIWFFHGARDEWVTVEYARQLSKMIRAAGGTVKYTEYPDKGHGIAPDVAAEKDAATWLLAQRRKR
jgi:predicted peptidase